MINDGFNISLGSNMSTELPQKRSKVYSKPLQLLNHVLPSLFKHRFNTEKFKMARVANLTCYNLDNIA